LTSRSSPPTSPQRAQSSARQAERDQRVLGSPPSRRQPHPIMQPPLHIPPALIVCIFSFFYTNYMTDHKYQMHPPVPVHQYPGIPRHQIAHHDMQRIYRDQMIPPINIPPPLPPPMLPQPPVLLNQPLPYQAFVPPPPQPQHFPQMGARVD
ncbi:hypothetical protein J3R83DRAFT_718, partial [Lanmaoa asiatica]